ncbi:TPA_asm: NarK family nitrate/nitrite MFS transporter [Salmonella enterica subsp. houtenae serovar 16:z4,z32:-]|uniref:Nitrate/nitrite transporter n=1 Tax=Salmonella enterica subsp. houtenae serovar 16:z4,z32:- TaxID=1307497 RepID=A0A735NYT5_SALHO|nr:NarK family nitrate/nitrite MFS transporter [Salmonella enterica]ECE6507430.1 NarK family nitrate/nitrite MFS transporter [Salmonella enterica subsp. houtenae]EDS7538897.1 NarK family nitrate/nitrite MFS transporter [Salmonella enterica subsp. enterica]EGI6409036.1 NarK family nitrate/nitrite MFS transporter [Salmonella enterica subsp. houtenae serovar 16:z4,z32:-]ENZ86966.1 Nitrite extrusion protein 2 [Salmonella enterica subsp. houtenae serovar 16:z4,z32:-- str. RKS3027]QGF86465.1 NarK fa
MTRQNENYNRYLLSDWRPENPAFWVSKGKGIARRNLWISVSCLLLAFCVWMLFSAVAVNLNKIGFNFTTDQLFLLTALPSLSGAILRVPWSFMVPLFGGRKWTVFSTVILIIPCAWLGFVVQNPATPFGVFMVIALLCGFAGANFASSMGNISFFFPKARQGSALGINGGLGNLGVSVMQLIAPLVIFLPIFTFLGVRGVPQPDGSLLSLTNAAWIWVPLLAVATLAAWFGMNDISSSKASVASQLPVLKRLHLWLLSLLYLATFGSFIGFSAGFAMLAKTQFPDVNILQLAFLGPFIGALARSAGGVISDKFGGVRVTLINFIFMALFTALLFLTLPGSGAGSFSAFYLVFMGLFLTAGLGSGSTFQMIAVIFRQITLYNVKLRGGSDEQAQREAVTDTAAALGFISAIGAVGGFFIPKAFGTSLALTGSPVGAMKIFLLFYIACVLLTWLVYGRRKSKQQ